MDDCIEWPGSAARKRYGQRRVNGRMVYAHRQAYEDAYGSIPPGAMVCHRCDNPPCVNPAHLYLGTKADNARDASERGQLQRGDRHWTARRTWALIPAVPSVRTANRGESNAHAKLTEAQAREVIDALRQGVRLAVLVNRYGVTRHTIYAIRSGRTWRHLPR